MVNRIVILTDPSGGQADSIDWTQIGTVVTEIGELYQLVKEQEVDLILVDENRHDLTNAVAIRLRRPNGLTEIWRVGSGEEPAFGPERYVDGFLSRTLGQEGVDQKVQDILSDKALLEKFKMVGRSPAMKAVARTIERIAPTEVPVLIVGASGTGKELVARALHENSARRKSSYVAVNCGALAEGVLESELFGHERGAFTGSVAKREGLFHTAEGGTIFLDEIGETKPDTQVKLLRVLEDGTYYPVGSSVPRRANVRVIAATNRDLSEAIADRQFREDLYFRISVVKVVLPPLIERRQDIQPLLQFFWRDHPKLEYADSALEMLGKYDWPGNIRQLRNFASRMAALKPKGTVDVADVEKFITEQHAGATHLPVTTGKTVEDAGQELIYRAILSLGNEIKMLRDLITSHLPSEGAGGAFDASTSEPRSGTMEEMEKVMIEKMLADTGGNRKEAARRLGIGERTLYRKLGKYRLR
ncbi:sigma-54-dependent Fis family transcriptional regulator [candidate division GN15 bacterium]|uniref:Sigma-54-dependent Fis family transcriptional regulator n=1 Tax=candidate division GN15 bacterium TaxID=2072418 RepID=A0A855X8I4_9BACT|nr:MAG: sigma-54-dependent Fis family transcriptional regulator [candidate division GN15 bacterium]